MEDDKLSRIMGCFIGTAIGDALGVRFEGSSGLQEVTELAPRYTDDTAMMLGVAESLVEHKGFDYYSMTGRFIKNYEREPWRRYKTDPSKIFRMMKSGRLGFGMLDRDLFPGGSVGNGGAVRVAPVGLLYNDNPRQLRETAYHTAEITHSSELSLEGAAVQACAVALAMRSDPKQINIAQFLGALKMFTLPGPYQEKLGRIAQLLTDGADKKAISIILGNSSEAFNSVPTAIYSFLANPGFANAVIYAVSLGGDADSIGAMTGAIAGACYGIQGIPQRWLDKVDNRAYLEEMSSKLRSLMDELKKPA